MLERNFYLGFSNFSGIGPIKFEKLLKHFGTAEAAWNASDLDLQSLIGEKLTARFIDFRKNFEIERYLGELEKEQVSFVCLSERK
jgi:predicted Rossmann fold nucleotide-binding protein DprA/Smf involved in DNA uptake